MSALRHLIRLAELAAASAYVVGLVEEARWIGGATGIAVAAVTPAAALVLLAVAAGITDVELRRKP